MKKLLILFFVFLTFQGLTQPQPPPCHDGPPTADPEPIPRGSIGAGEAQRRSEVYRHQKNRKNLIDPIGMDPCAFRDLVIYLTDRSKGYNGMRIYLGADPADFKQLIYVFVPTKDTVDSNDDQINRDDTTSCFLIVNQRLKKVWHEEASAYIREFQTRHVPDFNENARIVGGISDFRETTWLWYDMDLFRRGKDPYSGTTGMISVLQYLINNNKVDNVYIDMAAFDHTQALDYYYHIMLIFKFYKNATLKASFGGENSVSVPQAFDKYLEKNRNKLSITKVQSDAIRKFLGSFGYTDTGVPCPPPPPGKTCDQIGPLLP